MPADYLRAWQEQLGAAARPPTFYKRGLLSAALNREPLGRGPERWHISVSHRDRVPTWEELVGAAHELRPGVGFVVSIPPRSLWMNVHPHVLHLVETHDPYLQAQWREDARGDRPT